MMKRIISFLLAAVLCVSVLTPAVFAENAQFMYSEEDIEELYYDFEYVSAMVEDLFGSEDNLAYWQYANEKEDEEVLCWLIDKANAILGEEADKKYYAQLLTNMIAMFEYDMAQQIETQGQFDNMKNIKDYGLDLIDIAATAIGLQGKYKDLEKAIEAAADGLDLIIETTEELKYYELTIRNYSNAESFLRAVNEYSDNKELSDAAYELRTANKLLFEERITCIADTGANTGVFLAENYLSDFSFSLLRKTDAYKADDVVKDYVDYGEKAYDALDTLVSQGKLVFKVAMMTGDVLFGTTNTFKRHNEMMAMADIAEALIAAYEDINVSKDAQPQALYNNIRTKCEYYKMLLATHLRGEYLIYSLNYNDAGVLSAFTRWMDEHFSDEDRTIKAWYEGQANYCEEYYNKIQSIFQRLMQQKYVVHSGFELHDGFIVEIEQLDTVPDGYIGVYSFADFKKIADSCPSDTHFTSIRQNETEFNTAKYILMNDIECPADFDPAGAFYGVLDGNGYTIRNASRSLFLRVGNATIKNLGIEINYTTDTNDQEFQFGAIARFVNGWNNDEGVVIDNCFVKGNINITCRSGYFGGLIGNGEDATISNCYNEANITVNTRQGCLLGGISGYKAPITNCYNGGNLRTYATCENTFDVESINVRVGGIQGYTYAEAIRNCYNIGSISAATAKGCHVYTGGIIGHVYDGSFITYIENCYNIGTVTNEWAESYDPNEEFGGVFTPTYSSGGIIGFTGSHTYIKRCWNSGTISGEHFVGGIAGSLNSNNSESISDCYNVGNISAVQYAGGILGKDYYSTGMLNCYNAGMVSGAINCGSIAGTINSGEENLKNCYYLDNGVPATPAGINYSGVKSLTSEQMADVSSFEGYDFVDTWKLRDDDTMPQLKQ